MGSGPDLEAACKLATEKRAAMERGEEPADRLPRDGQPILADL